MKLTIYWMKYMELKEGEEMEKGEKLEKILSMIREMYLLNYVDVSEKELDKIYIETKITLESLKELKGENHE